MCVVSDPQFIENSMCNQTNLAKLTLFSFLFFLLSKMHKYFDRHIKKWSIVNYV